MCSSDLEGIRTAPRDVLICESTPPNALGKSFGIHKAMDMAGSAIGILIAFFLVRSSRGGFHYKNIFLLSAIPAVLGLIMLGFVREKKQPQCESEKINFFKNSGKLDNRLKMFLVITFLFTLGNSSNAFLLLRAQDKGFTPAGVILLYFAYNVTASILAMPLGRLSDKIGRKQLLVSGYAVFALVYFGFALAHSKGTVVLMFVAYGVYTAMTAGVERAFIAEISPESLKGTMLGLHSSLVGIALLPASAVAGFLWDTISPSAPFFFGGSLAVIAGTALYFTLRTPEMLAVKKQETGKDLDV